MVRDSLPAGVELRDLGEHRLKDLQRPEHIFQLVAEGLPARVPSAKHPRFSPQQPAHAIDPFHRAREGTDVTREPARGRSQPARDDCSAGRDGKTRLALKLPRQSTGRIALGVSFVALDRLNSADLIVQAVAEALPISLATKEDPKSRVISYLRDNPTLLVMDNFEHVLDGATFVQEMLEAVPRAQVLATSRVKLT